MAFLHTLQDLKSKLMPQNGAFDLAYMKELELADGRTAVDVANYMASAITNFNAGLLVDDGTGLKWLSSVVYITDKEKTMYGDGATPKFQDRTEYGLPDSIKSKKNGHMMRMKYGDLGMGFTKQKLQDMDFDTVIMTVDDMMDGAMNRIEADVLTTLTYNEDRSVGGNGISVPFVGGGNVPYTPKTFNGKGFSSSHSHYLRYTEAALAEALDAATHHLSEHGVYGIYDAFISESDLPFYAVLDDATFGVKWRNKQFVGVQYSNQLTLADTAQTVSPTNPGIIETRWGVIRLRVTNRIPSNPGVQRNIVIYRSRGANIMSNPVYWRIDPRKGGVMWAGEITTDFGVATTWNMYAYVNGTSSVGPNRVPVVNIAFMPTGDYTPPVISDE